MIRQILAVVDDSAAALRAAELAIDLASVVGAGLTLVTVVEDHVLDARLGAASIPEAAERRVQGAVAMMTRITTRASLRGLRTHQEILSGRGGARRTRRRPRRGISCHVLRNVMQSVIVRSAG